MFNTTIEVGIPMVVFALSACIYIISKCNMQARMCLEPHTTLFPSLFSLYLPLCC